MSSIELCGVCSNPFLEELMEEHHKVPRHLQGSDSLQNLINICPICHTAIHVLARLLKKNSFAAEQFVQVTFRGNPGGQTLVVQLAKVILLEAEQNPKKDFVQVPCRFDAVTHGHLRELAKSSRINMVDYLAHLINKEWKTQTFGLARTRMKLP